ncbi:MAG TPA: hypothetical protein VK846_16535 [Candidatus Limnocylindria bacterium]|nr:hypothetical protein [Candidatus Limnocylindria bacterium]
MGSSPDNDAVEKLLRLKRYEQPPPRYFSEFSGRVISRIERGEGRSSWWERLGFDLRPALAAGAGMVACGLIVYGVATTDGEAVGATSVMAFSPDSSAESKSLLANGEQTVSANSTNPVGTYGTPIDRTVFGGRIVPAQFQLGSQ